MKIGINFEDVIVPLASTAEDTEYYLRQLEREGHNLEIITNDSVDSAKKWLADRGLAMPVFDVCRILDVYIDVKFKTWWEIYNHIRYDVVNK